MGLCDAHLILNDIETATREAQRMLNIAEKNTKFRTD
jgi:hypothetical protein